MNLTKPSEIKGALISAGVTLTSIAHSEGVSVSSITQTINNQIRPERLRAAIARALNKQESDLWPDNKKAPSSGRNTADSVGADSVVPEDGHFLQEKTRG